MVGYADPSVAPSRRPSLTASKSPSKVCVRGATALLGAKRNSGVGELFVTADDEDSIAYRRRLWKFELQPPFPGTSEGSKIEHRLFSFIMPNWWGQPLHSFRTGVELIGSTTTKAELSLTREPRVRTNWLEPVWS